VLAAASLWQMVSWNLDVSVRATAINSVLQGVGKSAVPARSPALRIPFRSRYTDIAPGLPSIRHNLLPEKR
jgi:hypothetical protein